MKATLNEAEKPPKCSDCKHYTPWKATKGGPRHDKCNSPNNESVVSGSPRYSPDVLRHGTVANQCGIKGNWWEPK